MILILGYYDKFNLGDQAYIESFPKILEPTLINSLIVKTEIIFKNPYELSEIPSETEFIICGGGDIINDWFNDEFNRLFSKTTLPIYAVSIGITYPSTIDRKYFKHFDKVYVRHQSFNKELSKLLDSDNVFHIPDITFSLTPCPRPEYPSDLGRIGVFLANTINPDLIKLNKLREVLNTLFKLGYEIIFYPFNTSPLPDENDVIYAEKYFPEFERGELPPFAEGALKVISSLTFGFCERYHSHIFCIIQNVPFVSIAETPKAKLLLSDSGLNDLIFSDLDQINDILKSPENIKIRLNKIYNENFKILSNFNMERIEKKTIEEIHKECIELAQKSEKLEIIVSHALYNLTKSVSNKYTFGFIENLKKIGNLLSIKGKEELHKMLEWIEKDFSTKNRSIKLLQNPYEYEGIHRSGWEFVTKMLKQFETPDGLLCDLYVDGTFQWNEELNLYHGIIPFKKDWIGFIHHTADETFSDYNLVNLFKKESFLSSLKFCKCLIVLSTQNKNWLTNTLKDLNLFIPVYSLIHPTEFTYETFQIHKFLLSPKIFQIGAWLRDPYGIYEVSLSPDIKGSKYVLIWKDMENMRHPCYKDGAIGWPCQVKRFSKSDSGPVHGPGGLCRSEKCNICEKYILEYLKKRGAPEDIVLDPGVFGSEAIADPALKKYNILLKKNYEQVKIISGVDNDEYDSLLNSSVIFLHLIDAAAVNTLIECIVRNTPIIINKLPAVVEYLGPDYPLYYEDIDKVVNLDLEKIRKAHFYLCKMNKKKFMIDTFINGFKYIINEI